MLCCVVAFGAFAGPSFAGPPAAQVTARATLPATPIFSPGLPVCVARQRAGDTPAIVLAQPARFDCRRPQTDWGPGDYWVRLALPRGPSALNPATMQGTGAVQVRFVPHWQRGFSLHTRDAGGRIVSRSYDDFDVTALLRIGGIAGIALDGHDQPLTDVLFRVDGAMNAGGIVGEPQIVDNAGLHRDELIATAIFAAFAGLGIGLFCYNLVLWLTIRERFQLTYCLSLLAMLAYVWSNSGAMAFQFPNLPHTAILSTSYIMLSFVAALALQFIIDFIEPGMVPRAIRGVVGPAGIASVAAALAVAWAPPEWRYAADRVYVLTFIPLPVIVLASTFHAWRRGSRSVRVLAIAWALPTAMAVVRILNALHFIAYGPFVQYSLVLAMSVEALLSSLAMSFRIKLITDERDRALADERAARHLASVDSLTGLLNRRALLEQVVDWGSPEPLRLLLVDVDRFKTINDQHGHLVGDEVLRELAEVLAMRADLRASVARLGGEEFALIGTVDELSEGIALGVLADVRARLMAGHIAVTVSIGMADGMVRCEDEWREIYRRADAALYRAKADGRNRAVHAEPVAEEPAPGGSLVAA